MQIQSFPPNIINWNSLPMETNPGETGFSNSRSLLLGDIKVRLVEYSKDYTANHWCEKGHVIYLVEGGLDIEHADGSIIKVQKGMTYVIGDNALAHMAKSSDGAVAFIVD